MIVEYAKRRPIITLVLVLCTVAGTIAGAVWLFEGMTFRGGVLGAIMGAGTGFLITVTRMLDEQ